jgi:hypothetical protein
MAKLTALAVWTQVPVALRTVEVNTKTGFSLTAGSYSVRASSTQRGTVSLTSTSATATISSVTTTRANESYTGDTNGTGASSGADNRYFSVRIILTAATTITGAVASSDGSNIVPAFTVEELF